MKKTFEDWLSFIIEWGLVILALTATLAVFCFSLSKPAHAEADYLTMSNEVIANAIFKAEGGYKATYLYGIRSIPYNTEAEARRICINTIRNNKVRFCRQAQYKDFLDYLGSRYCPVSAHPLNKHWTKNVKYFLGEK